MRICLLRLLCLALLAAAPQAAHAQIYHCVGAHGEPVFSGQPCGTPAPNPTAAGTRGSGFGDHCAPSPAALRQAIGRAFAARDVNQLAGLIVWSGTNQARAQAELRVLAAWLQQQLVGISPTYAGGAPPADTATIGAPEPAPGDSIGPPPTGFSGATAGAAAPRDFGISQVGGCWWLTL